jgi:hypothetical protein
VRKTALKDALLPREIVALTTLPQSGFVQQALSLAAQIRDRRQGSLYRQ